MSSCYDLLKTQRGGYRNVTADSVYSCWSVKADPAVLAVLLFLLSSPLNTTNFSVP